MSGYYFPVGTDIVYSGELPCDETAHTGTVIAVEPDMSGDEIVTVEFDCGATQDIPASELESAESE